MKRYNKNKVIYISNICPVESTETHAMFPSPTKGITKVSQITAKKLSENLSDLINSLQETMNTIPESCGPYSLDELTFSLAIDSSGKISLIGELSAGMTTGIVIKLKKDKRR